MTSNNALRSTVRPVRNEYSERRLTSMNGYAMLATAVVLVGIAVIVGLAACAGGGNGFTVRLPDWSVRQTAMLGASATFARRCPEKGVDNAHPKGIDRAAARS